MRFLSTVFFGSNFGTLIRKRVQGGFRKVETPDSDQNPKIDGFLRFHVDRSVAKLRKVALQFGLIRENWIVTQECRVAKSSDGSSDMGKSAGRTIGLRQHLHPDIPPRTGGGRPPQCEALDLDIIGTPEIAHRLYSAVHSRKHLVLRFRGAAVSVVAPLDEYTSLCEDMDIARNSDLAATRLRKHANAHASTPPRITPPELEQLDLRDVEDHRLAGVLLGAAEGGRRTILLRVGLTDNAAALIPKKDYELLRAGAEVVRDPTVLERLSNFVDFDDDLLADEIFDEESLG